MEQGTCEEGAGLSIFEAALSEMLAVQKESAHRFKRTFKGSARRGMLGAGVPNQCGQRPGGIRRCARSYSLCASLALVLSWYVWDRFTRLAIRAVRSLASTSSTCLLSACAL